MVTDRGDRAFCTGTDLKKTAKMAEEESFAATYFNYEGYLAPLKMWKPVIAAINGYAIGGGLELALVCDIRIASAKASFGLSEVRVNSLPGLGGIQRMMHNIPRAVAMKMLLAAERIDVQEALRVGLISDVVEQDQLMAKAREIASKIAGNVPLSVRAAKQAAVVGADLPEEQVIMYDYLL